jgi:hypothetical protein
MRHSVAMLCAVACVGVDASDLILRVRGGEEPDPVHHKGVKREARRQQREQAKRMARARKGVHA